MAGGSPDHGPSLRVPVLTIGHWQPKIGDPSFIGWFTVVSYYLCAGLSLACFLKARTRMDATHARLRIAMTGAVIVLGLSKHFNLPGAVTEIGRLAVSHIGGYEWRRWIQGFMLFLAGVGLILVLRWSARHTAFFRMWQCCTSEMICLCYLGGLVILRAISLHQLGGLLAAEVFGVRVNWIAELAGVYALIVILLMRLLARADRTSSVR